jgi:putative transposase
MSHSYTKIWIHAVFGTKFRKPLIQEHFRQQLYDFIKNELHAMECYPKIINGTADHVDIAFRLKP